MSSANDRFEADHRRLSRLLELDGTRLRIDQHLAAGAAPDLDAGILRIGAWMAFGPEISAATHEIGHLMSARDEAVGSPKWGMDTPNLIAVHGQVYPMPVLTPGPVRTECRAWAWQWLIDEQLGLADPQLPPERTEAQWLEGWLALGSSEAERQALVARWQTEFRDAVLAACRDPIAAVRARIRRLPGLLSARAELESAAEAPGRRMAVMTNDDRTEAVLRRHADGRTTVYSVALETGLDAWTVCVTRSLERAGRFLKILASHNGLAPSEHPPHAAPLP